MYLVLKLLAGLYDSRDGDWADRVIVRVAAPGWRRAVASLARPGGCRDLGRGADRIPDAGGGPSDVLSSYLPIVILLVDRSPRASR